MISSKVILGPWGVAEISVFSEACILRLSLEFWGSSSLVWSWVKLGQLISEVLSGMMENWRAMRLSLKARRFWNVLSVALRHGIRATGVPPYGRES
ncbi:MAG: hypothetical protein J6S69_01800 [Proteobacteria bacterium]|nr:hypothetical protein [Pseudomonadota bacterium]